MDYVIEFRTLTTDIGWNKAALVDAFVGGLTQHIKEQLITLELLEDLDNVIAMINKIDCQQSDYLKERTDTPNLRSFSRIPRSITVFCTNLHKL